MFELLTKYIGVLNDENSGEWIIDQTHKGTMDDPKQFPFVAFSRLTENFINDVYKVVEEHPELDLRNYSDILEKNGLPLDGRHGPEDAKLSDMDLQGSLALLVAIIRWDRFCEGTIKKQIEKGTIDRCLKRIKELDG